MQDPMITDYDIQAFIDNELDWEQEKRVMQYIESNYTAKKRYEELLNQKKILQEWFRVKHD